MEGCNYQKYEDVGKIGFGLRSQYCLYFDLREYEIEVEDELVEGDVEGLTTIQLLDVLLEVSRLCQLLLWGEIVRKQFP